MHVCVILVYQELWVILLNQWSGDSWLKSPPPPPRTLCLSWTTNKSWVLLHSKLAGVIGLSNKGSFYQQAWVYTSLCWNICLLGAVRFCSYWHKLNMKPISLDSLFIFSESNGGGSPWRSPWICSWCRMRQSGCYWVSSPWGSTFSLDWKHFPGCL